MNRVAKVFIAFCVFLLGCIIATHPEIPSQDSFLNPVVQAIGFIFMFSGGLYAFLKMIRPFIY
ncbi:MAG: hypothetical protein JWP44_2110 [Mucilaginibacter sp.]|nr:hypothetical protein [Mucilaginibacter sp.]